MSELLARCVVDGMPVPQGSVRPVMSKTTGRTFVKQNPKMLDWRARIAEAARSQCPACFVTDKPLVLSAIFRLPRPKSARKSATPYELAAKRPDLSKLVRAVEDALTGVWYADDSLIVSYRDIDKRVCTAGERPGVDVMLYRVDEIPRPSINDARRAYGIPPLPPLPWAAPDRTDDRHSCGARAHAPGVPAARCDRPAKRRRNLGRDDRRAERRDHAGAHGAAGGAADSSPARGRRGARLNR
jgi:crossover junction endodeoxyribonuclease RusA